MALGGVDTGIMKPSDDDRAMPMATGMGLSPTDTAVLMAMGPMRLMEAVCDGRGWLLKGAQYDYDRCSSIVLDEFRAGKLGRITLERPPVNREQETY